MMSELAEAAARLSMAFEGRGLRPPAIEIRFSDYQRMTRIMVNDGDLVRARASEPPGTPRIGGVEIKVVPD